MAADPEELSRLSDQHKLIKDHMGKLVLAPIDLSVSGLRILDSATADGVFSLHLFLYNNSLSSAQYSL